MVSAYSIGTAKRPQVEASKGPGPQQYSPDLNQKPKSPAFSIGKAFKNSIPNQTQQNEPGPGQYNIKTTISQKGITIKGKYNNIGRPTSSSPGPGAYKNNYTVLIQKPPAFSIKSKTKDHVSQDIGPGPGQYDAKKTNRVTPYTFGKSIRETSTSHHQAQQPGPGNYNIDKASKQFSDLFVPSWKFGQSKRENSLHESYNSPGPGSYQLERANSSRGLTIGSKTGYNLDKNDSNLPGPGFYDISKSTQLKPRQPTFKIGTASRSFKINDDSLPGPGAYQLKAQSPTSQIRSVPSINFGNARKETIYKISDSPGPGAYEIKPYREGPNAIMLGSHTKGMNRISNDPGPGAYQPKLQFTVEKAPQAVIGTDARSSKQERSTSPGPGQYRFQTTLNGPKWVIGSSPRSKNEITNDIPGPGAYKLPPAFADVPKYLMNHKY